MHYSAIEHYFGHAARRGHNLAIEGVRNETVTGSGSRRAVASLRGALKSARGLIAYCDGLRRRPQIYCGCIMLASDCV
jgi:hypothetical protein